jgi:hypothetical protein
MNEEADKEKRDETTLGPEQPKYEDKDAKFIDAINNVELVAVVQEKAIQVALKGDLLWYRPVSKYTQKNLYDAVMLLTEKVNDYPAHKEVLTFIYCLTARLGALFLQPGTNVVFDMPEFIVSLAPSAPHLYMCNRLFLQWAGVYFYELLQRVHYYRYMYPRQLEPPDETLNEYVHNLKEYVLFLCKDMGRNDFKTLFSVSCEKYFAFPGDDRYGRIKHPEGVFNRGDLLLELRPERQGVAFFKTDRLSDQTIIEHVMTAQTHLYRLCLLNIMDRFFHVECDIHWRDGNVVDQSAIHLAHNKLIVTTMPCILFLFSGPTLHYKQKVYDYGNDLYKTIVTWLLIIQNDRQGMCHHVNITKQIKQLLGKDETIKSLVTRNPTTTVAIENPEAIRNGLVILNL